MRSILVFTLLLLAATSLSAAVRPNVVVLLADDLGWKDLGCYDGPVITPALDSLAAKGVRFTDFHSGAAVCSPSRATLLTGRHHLRTGVYTVIQDHIHNMHLRKSEVTIAEVLKANGYDTVHLEVVYRIGDFTLDPCVRDREEELAVRPDDLVLNGVWAFTHTGSPSGLEVSEVELISPNKEEK